VIRLQDLLGKGLLWLVGGVWLVPTLWCLAATFLSGPGGGPSLANLAQAWQAAPFATYLENTFVVVGGLLLIQSLVGMAVGFVLARYTFPLKGLVTGIYVLQLVVPVYAVLVQEYRIVQELGLLNSLLGIMAPYAVSGTAVLVFRQAFRSVPRSLEEAALLDGYSPLGVWRRVYLPFAWTAFLAFAVVSVSYHWTDFLWPLIVTNTPHARTVVVGLAMLAEASESGLQWNILAAATTLVVLPVLVVFAVGARRIVAAFARSFDF